MRIEASVAIFSMGLFANLSTSMCRLHMSGKVEQNAEQKCEGDMYHSVIAELDLLE